jgi:urease subunit gamma/beta
VHVTPRERERLLIAAAADLARRRLARGAPLGATEAVALVCDEVCELAWDGVPLAEVVERARAVVPAGALLPGVAALVPVIEVEALFPWGSTLVHVAAPFGAEQERRGSGEGYGPGAVIAGDGVIELAPGAVRRAAVLRNTGPRDVWVSSHFPLDQVNSAIEVRVAGDAEHCELSSSCRSKTADFHSEGQDEENSSVLDDLLSPAAGTPAPALRLDLPAGEALLLRAGEEREVTVVVA